MGAASRMQIESKEGRFHMYDTYVITTESTSDLPASYCEENQVSVIYMGYTLDGKTYSGAPDDRLPTGEFYQTMKSGSMPTTFQVTPAEATAFFEAFLRKGVSVLHIGFSSGLSGSCQSEQLAAAQLNEKYQDARVIVVDSLCASMGEGLLTHEAVQLKKKGLTLEENAKQIEATVQHICHMFTVDDLNHLHRGGRVSKATAILGTALGIKPVLHVDEAGHLVPVSKVRGRKQSLAALVDYMEKTQTLNAGDAVFISHGNCPEDAQFVQELVEKKFDVKTFLIHDIGPVIGTHSGPGTVALFYRGKTRNC